MPQIEIHKGTMMICVVCSKYICAHKVTIANVHLL